MDYYLELLQKLLKVGAQRHKLIYNHSRLNSVEAQIVRLRAEIDDRFVRLVYILGATGYRSFIQSCNSITALTVQPRSPICQFQGQGYVTQPKKVLSRFVYERGRCSEGIEGARGESERVQRASPIRLSDNFSI